MLVFSVATFLIPALVAAAALAVIAVPLIVHRLVRPRERSVRWAAMRFLPMAPPRRNRRIDHWPLFLARLGTFLLILLAMLAVLPGAERVWQSIVPGELTAIGTGPRTHTIFVIDATFSMRSADGLAKAKEKALAIVAGAPPGDAFSLLVLDGDSPVHIAGPSHQPDVVSREIEALTPFDGPSAIPAALTAAADILSRSPPSYVRKRVLILTDLRRSAWTPLMSDAPAEAWKKLTAKSDVAFLDCGSPLADNVAVTDLALADTLPLVDDPLLVTFALRNTTPRERTSTVELALARPGGSLVPIGTIPVAIPAEATATGSFRIEGTNKLRSAGPHALRVRLVEPDALEADNTRQLAFDVREAVTVLVVNGQPSGTPLKRASEYFSEALAPRGRGSPGTPFRVRTINVDDFRDATLSDLAAVDCVVLCDVPSITPSQVSRLDGLLQRGGGVIIGMGPRAQKNRELYNRLLGPDGAAFIPGTLENAITPTAAVHLSADGDSFRQPPLEAFQEPNARAGLAGVPFTTFVELRPATQVPARTLLRLNTGDASHAALVELSKHRGRVLTFTSTWNREWTDWPVLPSYLPFVHELVRYTAAHADPWTYAVGQAIADVQPATSIGHVATLDGMNATVTPSDAGAVARFPALRHAGLFDLAGVSVPHKIAVNSPSTAAALAESDLRRLDVAALAPLGLSVVQNPDDAVRGEDDTRTLVRRDQGPIVARGLVFLALAGLILELILAWRNLRRRGVASVTHRMLMDRIALGLAVMIVLASVAVLVVVVPTWMTGELPEFVPYGLRSDVENWLEVPTASAGEGTHWHFARQPAFTREAGWDRGLILTTVLLLCFAAMGLYHRERRLSGRWFVVPLFLRLSAYGLFGFVLLPQMRIDFEREGLPFSAVVIDTSASMGTIDSPEPRTRLDREKARIIHGGLLPALLDKRQRVHVYAINDSVTRIAEVETVDDLATAHQAIRMLEATGSQSRLGDGVKNIIQQGQGANLNAVILASDGITTQGPGLADAGREAHRRGVALFTLGTGDRKETLDLALAEVKMDDSVVKGDELIVDARVLVRGTPPGKLTVNLRNGTRVVDSQTIDAGQPVKLKHRPDTVGETTYVIEAVPHVGEADVVNNRVERTVQVTEGKKIRVLMIEGRPRYEFRFLKTLLEREVEIAGERSVEFRYVLQDAGKDFASTDRTALRSMPSRTEMFEYDVVILGDFDPALLPAPSNITDLVDFVRVRGGGLLWIAGEQNLGKYFDTPLAEILPVLKRSEMPVTREDAPLQAEYRLKLTPLGGQHPVFRLRGDDAENTATWARLMPLSFATEGIVPRAAAEVLAVHPQRLEPDHALAVQMFAGAGRVLFFGFDETWRWRYRKDEELFNRFWRQAVRVLARNRVGRVDLKTLRPGPFRRDEPISIQVRFPDDGAVPTENVSLRIERIGSPGDRESQTVVCRKDDSGRGTFETTLPTPREGTYRVTLASPARPSGTLEFSVRPPPGEMERLSLDAADLAAAASLSGGKYYPIDDSAALNDELPEGIRVPLDVPCPPRTLWNLPVVFVAIVSLLGLEWLLRKRAGRL